ncbi:endothelial cell-selective adhesion molecule isoform X2 [Mugil cephalus]|uniref:endothelial cell-selective adhesion molecule isoform X2 n=1 Tax=Mugil cephalus TaxID=48193 RepID=UPI001FB64637|nr:endothelial cell-selective adhesion molecule isoform X2 [Mugil cephalus]XP_047433550.1 endothelial cell-selective adhesion molecule isoform X2 [Mugil cephalus]
MASCGTITFIFGFFIFITAVNTSSMNVKCSTESVGEHGHESLLNCVVETAADDQIRVVIWKKGEEILLRYYDEELTLKPGYRFADPSWMNTRNVSLLITNTVVTSEGEYSCKVHTYNGDDGSTVSFKVKAKYSEPRINSIPENIPPNTDSTLICKSEGGYPQGEIRWFDENHQDWTKSSKMEVIQTDNGLYQLSSNLALLSGSTFSKYTCVVFNSSGGKEGEATYEITSIPEVYGSLGAEEGGKEASKIVAPIVVIGSLLVGLLMVLLYKRRSHRPYMHGGGCHHEECRQEAEEVMDTNSPA